MLAVLEIVIIIELAIIAVGIWRTASTLEKFWHAMVNILLREK